jgi:hypothetical protein
MASIFLWVPQRRRDSASVSPTGIGGRWRRDFRPATCTGAASPLARRVLVRHRGGSYAGQPSRRRLSNTPKRRGGCGFSAVLRQSAAMQGAPQAAGVGEGWWVREFCSARGCHNPAVDAQWRPHDLTSAVCAGREPAEKRALPLGVRARNGLLLRIDCCGQDNVSSQPKEDTHAGIYEASCWPGQWGA